MTWDSESFKEIIVKGKKKEIELEFILIWIL